MSFSEIKFSMVVQDWDFQYFEKWARLMVVRWIFWMFLLWHLQRVSSLWSCKRAFLKRVEVFGFIIGNVRYHFNKKNRLIGIKRSLHLAFQTPILVLSSTQRVLFSHVDIRSLLSAFSNIQTICKYRYFLNV